MKSDYFPIPLRKSIPAEIEHCNILETVFEMRFQSTLPWTVVPGLVFGAIRSKYPIQVDLPQNQIPDEVKLKDKDLLLTPFVQFKTEAGSTVVQLGPQLVSLNFTGKYLGWKPLRAEIEYVLTQINQLQIFGEINRVGLRYIDFFNDPLLSKLKLNLTIGSEPVIPPEVSIFLNLRQFNLDIKLQFHQSATRHLPSGESEQGSILDIDVYRGPEDLALNENIPKTLNERILQHLETAHDMQKKTFFSLLTDDFLDSLDPKY